MPSNPFSVGAVRPTQYMLGRSDQLADIRYVAGLVQEHQESHRRCFLGPPGSGKTSILKYAQHLFLARDWLCGYSEASPDAATAIGEFLHDVRRALPRHGAGQKYLSKITEISMSFGGFGAGIKLSEDRKPAFSLVLELFAALGDLAMRQGVGVAILIDEAQALPGGDLDLLIRSISRLDRFPITLVMAGLPSIPGKLDREDGPTNAVTWFSMLHPLTQTESFEALGAPIRDNGRTVRDSEIARMADFSEGHPLTLQMLGSQVWDIASDSPDSQKIEIDASHVSKAIGATHRQLLLAYYEPMWRRCDESERRTLAKLAYAPQPVDYFMFIDLSWKATPEVDRVILGLRDRGVLQMRDNWSLEFSIPGFRDYVRRATRPSL
jgi:hypothetical protein